MVEARSLVWGDLWTQPKGVAQKCRDEIHAVRLPSKRG
jgi:hypothetical protein